MTGGGLPVLVDMEGAFWGLASGCAEVEGDVTVGAAGG